MKQERKHPCVIILHLHFSSINMEYNQTDSYFGFRCISRITLQNVNNRLDNISLNLNRSFYNSKNKNKLIFPKSLRSHAQTLARTQICYLALHWPEKSVWQVSIACRWRLHRPPVPPAEPAGVSSLLADADKWVRSRISRCTRRTAGRGSARRSGSSRSPVRGPSRRSPWVKVCTGAALRHHTARIW